MKCLTMENVIEDLTKEGCGFNGSIIKIAINGEEFEITATENEINEELNKVMYGDFQGDHADVVVALTKLINYIRVSAGISIPDKFIR